MTTIAFPTCFVASATPLAGSRRHQLLVTATTAAADDAELLAAVRRDEPDAWRQMVTRHQGAVAAVVIGMLGRGDEADDVGQETFIRFHRSLASFRGDASVRTWLQRIAMNLSLNALKRRKRGLRRFLPFDESMPETTPSLQVNPLAQHDDAATREIIHAAIATLPEIQRAVVVLRLIEGYTTLETAALLSIPAGTVLSRLARATAQLRRQLVPLLRSEQDRQVNANG